VKPSEELSRHAAAYALSLPGAIDDMPWEGDRVAKVNRKIFAFLGGDGQDGSWGFGVKLPRSAAEALARGDATPMAYGLGKHGWVTFQFQAGNLPSKEEVEAWIEESWEAFAPKKLVKARAQGS
jgi:predicted DNA-binding protein (MmcQ/YjbR family)